MKCKLTKNQIKEVMNCMNRIAIYIDKDEEYGNQQIVEINALLESILPIKTIDETVRRSQVANGNHQGILLSFCCLQFRVNQAIQGEEIDEHRLRDEFQESSKAVA